ncbi:glycosyl hydrolase family 71-domain-containing protein [Panaeolus papilionaceus]|nr:glycosyl hydrolase family 71-domain-containing protein [Panaeolus papilionaceus]
MRIFHALVAACLAAQQASAKAVFAHFMIGNTGSYSVSDFIYDMQLAQQAAIDGFALNMAYGDSSNDHSIPLAFQAANQVGFKLFFSFDYAGNGAWPASTVQSMIQTWSSQGSYFRHSTGQPLVSTFEGPGNAGDWHNIKAATNAFFIPDWSSLGAMNAIAQSNGVADGLFNWGAWPDGTATTNWDLDASYLIFLSQAKKPTYMAPISPWFFTNMPGYNKNWLWQGGLLWFQRWERLSALSVIGQDQWPNQPEYLQIISWNDYGESHYIGPLNDKAYLAFDRNYGNAPFNYVLGHPHDGWRQMLPFMITMWKTGTAVVTQEVVTAWYRLTPGTACGSGGTTGNTASQGQSETSPQTLSPDKVYVAALLTRLSYARVTIGGRVFNVNWESLPSYSTTESVGIYYGSVDTQGATGTVKVEIVDTNQGTVGTLNGQSIQASCPNVVVNWNAWVGSTTLSRSISPTSPSVNLKQQQCIKGSGSLGQYNELCQFVCNLGYCPPGPCTCYTMGKNTASAPVKNVSGYPLPGKSCAYIGLCSYACNHGFCPSSTCTTDPNAAGRCV